MREISFILFLLIFSGTLPLSAQINNYIFPGSYGDGYDSGCGQKEETNAIFGGSIADGYVSGQYVREENNMVFAGSHGDGFAQACEQQLTNNAIYAGITGDGFSSVCIEQLVNNGIFAGSNDDGYDLAKFESIVNNNIFAGSNSDGYDLFSVLQLTNNGIYAGSTDDGYDLASSSLDPLPPPIPHTIYVDSAVFALQTGASWIYAFTDMKTALVFAEEYPQVDSILVAKGTYLPSDTEDRTLSFEFPDSIAVMGGFPTGGSSLVFRNPIIHPAVLSGDVGVQSVSEDNVLHVIQIEQSNLDIILDGFHVRDGYANEEGNKVGSAMLVYGNAEVRNTIMENNRGVEEGSVIYLSGPDSRLTIDNCLVLLGPDSNPIAIMNSNGAILRLKGQTEVKND